jgi:hypothetical protein
MPANNYLPGVLETTEAEHLATGFIFTEGPLWHRRAIGISSTCRLIPGAKEIRTLRPTLNASVPRGATWVPRTAPGFGVAPPSS